MQKIIVTTVKLLIHRFIDFIFTGVPNYSVYQSYAVNYIIVHHFISC